MSSQGRINEMIERWGKTVTILRDAQNITEKRSIVRSFNSKLQTSPILQEMSYFRWDSEIRAGDIFQDVLGQERSLVVAIEFLGTDAVKDGLRVTALRCNDSVILYEIIPSGAQNEFGKKRYNDTVRVNDFAFVYQSVQ